MRGEGDKCWSDYPLSKKIIKVANKTTKLLSYLILKRSTLKSSSISLIRESGEVYEVIQNEVYMNLPSLKQYNATLFDFTWILRQQHQVIVQEV